MLAKLVVEERLKNGGMSSEEADVLPLEGVTGSFFFPFLSFPCLYSAD